MIPQKSCFSRRFYPLLLPRWGLVVVGGASCRRRAQLRRERWIVGRRGGAGRRGAQRCLFCLKGGVRVQSTGQSRRKGGGLGWGVVMSSLARSHISLSHTDTHLTSLLLRPDVRDKDRRVNSSGGSLSSLFTDVDLSHSSRSLSPHQQQSETEE